MQRIQFIKHQNNIVLLNTVTEYSCSLSTETYELELVVNLSLIIYVMISLFNNHSLNTSSNPWRPTGAYMRQ